MSDDFGMRAWIDAIPGFVAKDIIAWATQNVRLPGSARSERFDASITPWIRRPMDDVINDDVRMITFVKPVQSGGSVLGEVTLCYWCATNSGGDVQYNWQTDDNADDRWDKRTVRILRACKAITWPEEKFAVTKGMVLFPRFNFTMQGVFTRRRVASDTIKFQINEEIHDEQGWKPGRLRQAHARTTALWDYKILNISNAGRRGSELHRCFEQGTMQSWESPCPECGKWHSMRIRWDDKRPDLGGLRYNADGCRLSDGEYDYTRLASTVRYQFPCGHEMRDDVQSRRALSLASRYGDPQNKGADKTHRSYTFQAVSVDYIPWLQLIKEKHDAMRAMKYGDPGPWQVYLRERECVFASDDDRPFLGKLVVSKNITKQRDGLVDREFRFAACDFQRGDMVKRGEFAHWWIVIRDVMPNGDSRLVWEGKATSDDEAAAIVSRHGVKPWCVVCDSGHDATHVYQFCLKHGFNAIKGSGEAGFTHADKSIKIYSPEKPLHGMINSPPCFEYQETDPGVFTPDPREPMFWHYSKSGIRDRLAWIRSALKWEVPEDVSEDYKSHMESEELQSARDRNGAEVKVWKQILERNDLFVCECYIAMWMDKVGIIGSAGLQQP